jgi:transcriptional regulator with XRE-family HTH domain
MEEEKVETRGRPAHEPTESSRKLVKVLSGVGLTQKQIADKLDISVPTLHEYYRREIDLGKADAISSIAQTLFAKAKNGDNASMFFFLKTQGRWKENHDNSNSEGKKIVVVRGGFAPNE